MSREEEETKDVSLEQDVSKKEATEAFEKSFRGKDEVTHNDLKPRVASPRDYSGKLPNEFVKEFIESAEKFKQAWEESLSFSLQLPHLVDLSFDEPFLGSLSRRIRKTRTADVPTAGVTVVKDAIELYWNPIFFKKVLKFEHVKGVLKHELYHVIFEHLTSRKQTPPVLWNVATDCAINSLIPRRELPDFCLFPGELYVPPNAPPDWKPGIIAKIIKNLPREKSSEWYMQYFLNDPEIQKAMQRAKAKAQAQQTGENSSDNGSGDDGKNDENGSGNKKSKGSDADQGDRGFNSALADELFAGDGAGQFDDHDIWDNLSDDQRDMMRDYIRDIFRSCAKEAEQRSTGWGSIPESLKQHIKKLISKEIDWRELINKFVGRSRSTQTTSSLKRMNRRFPWDHPGRKRAYSALPAIAIDQSGSMHNEWIELLFAEVSNLGNLTSYDVIPFDYDVDEKNIQKIRRGMKPDVKRTRGGGTNFDAVVEFINKKPGAYDCLFFLTDGVCSAPRKCNIPLAYILAPGCELQFDPKGALVIKMTDTRKK